jgi:uncharacterized protein (TIGR02444 family)
MDRELRKVGANPELEADSWAFALAVYARPGVAEACLTLQNEAGVDVMLLLMVTFAAVKHRILLTPDEIKALDDACRLWRERIVRKLRTIRTELKTGPQPAPSETTEQFRSQVKALELAAEKLENQLLAECLPLKAPGRETVRPEQLRAVLENVVALFAERRGAIPRSNFSSSIDAIVEGAIQDAF